MKRHRSSADKKGLMCTVVMKKKLGYGAVMKRRRLSSADKEGRMSEIEREKKLGLKCTVTQINREKKETVYAVFETDREDVYGGEYEYLIYKLDSSAGSQELVMPIETLKPGKYPLSMSFFSVGSKFYFIGGIKIKNGIQTFTSKAYMFDTNSNQGTVLINSMNCPKPDSKIFGPVDDDKFYVFGGPHPSVGDGGPSFEVFNTSTNTWESLELPDYLSGVTFHTSSVLCGSNILISDSSQRCLYVFCTRFGIWRQLPRDNPASFEPYKLPFLKARPFFHGNAIGHVFLASHSSSDLPEVYYSTDFFPALNEAGKIYDPVGPLQDLGEVEDPINLLSRDSWGNLVDFYCFKDKICLLRSAESDKFDPVCFAINICDVTYIEGYDLKIKVKNTLQYALCSNYPLCPMHVHVVE